MTDQFNYNEKKFIDGVAELAYQFKVMNYVNVIKELHANGDMSDEEFNDELRKLM